MTDIIKREVQKLMRRVREGRVPPSEVIVEEAFKELGYLPARFASSKVRKAFNKIFYQAWTKTLEVLERYEEKAYPRGIPEELIRLRHEDVKEAEDVLKNRGFIPAIVGLFEKLYPYLRRCYLSIAQSRKARGGKDFELTFGRLLELAEVPYEKLERTSRVDFMLPSDAAFQHNPTAAAIASAKRTLRERWREVVEELQATRSPNIFLVTADSDISAGHVEAICGRYRIQLVVWDEIKTSRFPIEPLVLSYSQWANERLPVLEAFWKESR